MSAVDWKDVSSLAPELRSWSLQQQGLFKVVSRLGKRTELLTVNGSQVEKLLLPCYVLTTRQELAVLKVVSEKKGMRLGYDRAGV